MSNIKENLGNRIAASKSKRKLFLTLFVSVLLIAAIISVVTGVVVASRKKSDAHSSTSHHAILRSSCSSTLYPELCFSEVSAAPEAATKIKSMRDVIDLSLNVTKSEVQKNYVAIQKLIGTRKGLTVREKTALNDCLEMVKETLDQLTKCDLDLKNYPSQNKSISKHADDLKILLSAAMTDQDTCLDGFSHDKHDKKIRELLIAGQTKVYKMCSNSLAMIKNLTDTDMAMKQNSRSSSGRRLMEGENESDKNNNSETEWPDWLSAGDRRLLQATTVTPNVVVAADGSGDYLTVAAAVAAAPSRSTSRYIIRVKAGVYRENVDVPSSKTNIMIVGDGRDTTIITGNRNVVDGSTTFNSATFAAVGDGFLARDITFQNTAGPSKHQAVALRVGSDLSAFYRCDMLAYQDTLYVHSLRQFFVSCFIAGTVDFIFGNAAAVLQNCDIHARRPNAGQRNMVTAQGREDPNQNTGIVIQNCRIGATSDLLPVISSFPSYLGRPWKLYSRTVIMQTDISNVINPAGWYPWDGTFALDTLYYAEYQNTGAGADTSQRVTWPGYKVITSASEAQMFTPGSFIAGANWLPATGFPYMLGLSS